jgi:hypothetical protein
MFHVFIEGVEGATLNTEHLARKRRGAQTPQVTYTKSDKPISHNWAYVDGYWADGKMIMNDIAFSKSVDWPDANTHRERVMQAVLDSAHMARVLKTLQKL